MEKEQFQQLIRRLHSNDRTLKELDLSCQPGQPATVTRKEIEIIGDYLQYNTKLGKLDLSGNDFGDEELEYLVRKLYHNEKLKSLNLANTQITGKGLEALAALMFFNTQIVELNLAGTPAMQDKESARSLGIIKQALINNRTKANEKKIRLVA